MFCPRSVPLASAKVVSALAAGLAFVVVAACAQQTPAETPETVAAAATAAVRAVDILVMVDNSSSMTSMQQKMLVQIPTFIQSLQALPEGLPDIHMAVVSSDLGAPSDQGQAGIGCSQSGGDRGIFYSSPQGTCTATTLTAGATFIADNATGSTKNFTASDPAGLASVFECIALLGSSGCGFEHQLASVARALGADGQPAPVENAGFLRPGAELAIIFLTNEDDCSASASNTPLPVYSLNGDSLNDINTPDGPIANYRCNGGPLGGHLCSDPTGALPSALEQPPLNPPADAVGNPPSLTLTNCESNDTSTSALIPVTSLIAGIKALKAQPDSEIVVGAVMAPSTPYVVEWLPGAGTSNNQLWPQVAHSCLSPTGDGSFGDPPVRIAQFVQAFGDNGVTGSICDGSYAPAFQLIASKIAAHLPVPGSDGGAFGNHDGSGAAGNNGTGGFGASNGSGGTHGSGGTPGTGSGGTLGNAGTNGSGGTHGSGGTSGTGSGGTLGNAGTNGTTGAGGTTSAGGTTGAGGTTATGAAGHAGTNGTAGTTGTASGGAPGGGGIHGAGAGGEGGSLGNGSGCGCETGGSPTGAWGVTLLLGLALVRRRRSGGGYSASRGR